MIIYNVLNEINSAPNNYEQLPKRTTTFFSKINYCQKLKIFQMFVFYPIGMQTHQLAFLKNGKKRFLTKKYI